MRFNALLIDWPNTLAFSQITTRPNEPVSLQGNRELEVRPCIPPTSTFYLK